MGSGGPGSAAGAFHDEDERRQTADRYRHYRNDIDVRKCSRLARDHPSDQCVRSRLRLLRRNALRGKILRDAGNPLLEDFVARRRIGAQVNLMLLSKTKQKGAEH